MLCPTLMMNASGLCLRPGLDAALSCMGDGAVTSIITSLPLPGWMAKRTPLDKEGEVAPPVNAAAPEQDKLS